MLEKGEIASLQQNIIAGISESVLLDCIITEECSFITNLQTVW